MEGRVRRLNIGLNEVDAGHLNGKGIGMGNDLI